MVQVLQIVCPVHGDAGIERVEAVLHQSHVGARLQIQRIGKAAPHRVARSNGHTAAVDTTVIAAFRFIDIHPEKHAAHTVAHIGDAVLAPDAVATLERGSLQRKVAAHHQMGITRLQIEDGILQRGEVVLCQWPQGRGRKVAVAVAAPAPVDMEETIGVISVEHKGVCSRHGALVVVAVRLPCIQHRPAGSKVGLDHVVPLGG